MHSASRHPHTLLAAVTLLTLGAIAFAGDIVVDGSTKHQVVRGFGTCLKSWGKPWTCPVTKWQQSPEFAKLYVDELRFNVARIPINKFVLEGELESRVRVPDDMYLPNPHLDKVKEDPALISHDMYMWKNSFRIKSSIAWLKRLQSANPDMLFLGSVWSPPHWMKEKQSFKTYKRFGWSKPYKTLSVGGRLAPRYRVHFAHYLAEWIRGLEEVHDLDLYAVSIQNEPQFWEPYDSCMYTPEEYLETLREVGRVFGEESIEARLFGPEDMTKFPKRVFSYVIPVMNDEETRQYLDVVAAHGYGDGVTSSIEARESNEFRSLMEKHAPDREYWMTETGGGTAQWDRKEWTIKKHKNKKKIGQKVVSLGALSGFGGMLHNAFVYGHCSLWSNWQFFQKDGGCSHAFVHATMERMTPSKKFYVVKHYSRFIPPNAHRVDATPSLKDDLSVSAYVHAEEGSLTVILTNHAEEDRTLSIDVRSVPEHAALHSYLTTRDVNCEPQADVPLTDGAMGVTVPARSLMTLSNVQ